MPQYPVPVVGGGRFAVMPLSTVPPMVAPEPAPVELPPPPQPARVITNAVNSASNMIDGPLITLFIVANLKILGQKGQT